MRINKMTVFRVAIAFTILLALPFFIEVHHRGLYYFLFILVVLPISIIRLLFDKKIEQSFYKKWGTIRKKGYWKTVLREGLRSFVGMILIILFGMYMGNGLTPQKIWYELSNSVLIGLTIFLILLSLLFGILSVKGKDEAYGKYIVGKLVD